jgi:spermidine/putrescine transport system substrate-binding protein
MGTKRMRGLVAAMATALVVAACGGGSGDVAAADCELGQVDGDLRLYNWSNYMNPELIDAFKAEFGVNVIEDFYPSNEELFARVAEGGAQFDVIVPSDYMVGIMIEEGLLLPIDRSVVPNWVNVAEDFRSPPYDPDLAFSMPYQWGTTGLGVNVGLLGDVEPSWALIFDPAIAANLPGRITLLDDPRETLGAALYYLGYSPNTTSEDELAEAAAIITQAKAWTAAFNSDQYSELLIGGESVIAHGYSGNILDNIGDDENFVYLIPEEGATIWTDNMAVLVNAPHPCTAQTFINFILDAQNGADLTNWTYYGSPNAAADPFIDPEILEDEAIYPSAAMRERLFFLEDTGDFEIRFTDLYTQAKS